MSSYLLRVPVADDVPQIASLLVECWKQTYADLLPEGFFTNEHHASRVRQWERITTDLHERPEMGLRPMIALLGEQAIGVALAGPVRSESDRATGARLSLYMLYVLREHHGTGVGQRLLDAVLGQEPTMLWVAQENPRAIAFYQRNGFYFDGQTEQDPAAPAITDARMLRL
ncbi:GNAT family N-acetyltransferase [Glutamicibacter endophyticus]